MQRRSKFKIGAAGAVIAVLILGAGIATAHTKAYQGNNPVSRVLTALVGNGTINQNQADAITKAFADDRANAKAQQTTSQTAFENLVASTIGIDSATLKSRLRAGETLATIAGKKKDALIAALIKFKSAEIDARVIAGQMLAAEATTEKSNLQTRITAGINSTHPMMGGHGHGHRGDDQPNRDPSKPNM